MRSSLVLKLEEADAKKRNRSGAVRSRRKNGARERIVGGVLAALRLGGAEADLRRFALGGRGNFEELALFEAKHAGEDVGGELFDLGVQVADDCVVIAAGVLHGIF